MNDPERTLIAATIEKYIEHERQHGPLSKYSGCRCNLCDTVRKYKEKWETDFAAGLTYSSMPSEGDDDWIMKCNACGAVSDIMNDPFPHVEDCLLHMTRMSAIASAGEA